MENQQKRTCSSCPHFAHAKGCMHIVGKESIGTGRMKRLWTKFCGCIADEK